MQVIYPTAACKVAVVQQSSAAAEHIFIHAAVVPMQSALPYYTS